MRRRRIAGLGVAALLLAGSVTPWVLHASSTTPPSNPSYPDFSNGALPQETRPSLWELDVVTGGISAGDPLTLTFVYKGQPGDHLHAATFSSAGSDFHTFLTVSSVPALPVSAPGLDPPRPTRCLTGTQSPYATQASADPYGQTITLASPASFGAGTVIVYCFNHGAVGFPLTADPSGYAIRYQEPSGTVDAPYVLSPQATPPASNVVRVLGADGSDVSGTGIGGSTPLVYDTPYRIRLVGSPTGTYSVSTTALMDTTAVPDVRGDPGPAPTCPGGEQLLCPDTSGVATGTLIVHPGADVAYVVIMTTNTARANSENDPSEFSVSVGPAGSGPPVTHTPPPTPPPPPGQTPAPKPGYDGACNGPYASASGLGALEMYDANNQVFMPDFRAECADAAKQLTLFGVTDDVALQSRFVDSPPEFSFAGLDRPLSASEYAQYGSTAHSSVTGVQQFPIDLEPLVVAYNLNSPSCDNGAVKLSSTALTAIFTGAVTQWSQLATIDQADDANLAHCDLPILVAHDIGVASYVLKDYMGKRTPVWNAYKQPQLAASWPGTAPVSCTANGSSAMALCILGRPGTIGYGFYRAINAAGLPVAQVDNTTHTFFDPQTTSPLAGCTTAADPSQNPAAPQQTSQDFSSTTLTDAPVGYPICSFDFVTAPTNVCARPNISHGTLLVLQAYLGAIYSPYSQGHLPPRGYAQLPADLADSLNKQLSNLTCG